MFGLILKDFVTLKKTLFLYFIIAVCYAVLALLSNTAAGFMGIVIFFATMIPIASKTYDESARWDRYVLTMPLPRAKIVFSKYFLGLICLIPAIILSFLIGMLGKIDFFENIVVCSTLTVFALLIMAIDIPIVYQLGSERGRIVSMLVFFAPAMLIYIFAKMDIAMQVIEKIQTLWIWILITVLLVSVLSIFLSIHIYKRKEF